MSRIEPIEHLVNNHGFKMENAKIEDKDKERFD